MNKWSSLPTLPNHRRHLLYLKSPNSIPSLKKVEGWSYHLFKLIKPLHSLHGPTHQEEEDTCNEKCHHYYLATGECCTAEAFFWGGGVSRIYPRLRRNHWQQIDFLGNWKWLPGSGGYRPKLYKLLSFVVLLPSEPLFLTNQNQYDF